MNQTVLSSNSILDRELEDVVASYAKYQQWEIVEKFWCFDELLPDIGFWGKLFRRTTAKTTCCCCGAPARRYKIMVRHLDGGEPYVLSSQPTSREIARPKITLCPAGHYVFIYKYAYRIQVDVLLDDGTFTNLVNRY